MGRLDQTSTDKREKLDVYRHQRRGDQTSTDELGRLDQTSTDEREKLDVYRHQRRGDQTSTDELGRLDQTSTDEREKLDVYRHQRRGDQTLTNDWEDSTRRQRTKGRSSTFIDTNEEVNTSLGKEDKIFATGNQIGRLPMTLLGISG